MTPNEHPRLLAQAEHAQVSRLFQRITPYHLHLDWRSLEEWLPNPNLRCWVTHSDGSIQSIMGATLHLPQGAPGVAWLRCILPAPTGEVLPLDRLWEALRADLRSHGVGQVAIMALDDWVGSLAARWRFSRTNAVITLRRMQGEIPSPPSPPLRIRKVATGSDLDEVARLDSLAFEPLWQYSRETLAIAQQQAATFTVLEEGADLLGYQLSTQHVGSGHLARLAIRPDVQGRGLAALLVGDMLRFMHDRNIRTVTVNTQEDNIRSQRLYVRLGFEFTGHKVPIWTIDL